MDSTDRSPGTASELPEVDEHVVQAMRDSHDYDPDDSSANFRTTIEEDQTFAHQIIIEGNRRSQGDISRQSAFIEGANFAREALRRTAALRRITEVEVDELVPTESDELTLQPQLEKAKRRFGFGSMSALVAVFSMFRHSGNRPI